MVGFWVQRMGAVMMFDARQTLQPMHSRMSSGRPSSIFSGRNGSAMEGRAAPMKSSTPRLTIETMVSGLVNRPTPTTGLLVTCLTKATPGSCQPSLRKRDPSMSSWPPTFTSQRSGTSASISTVARPSSAVIASSPYCSSTQSRTATAHFSPATSSRTSSSTSRSSRVRFSMPPPYSSMRRLMRGERKSVKTVRLWPT